MIIPTYNWAALVTKALDSSLNQTRAANKVIAFNDGSANETEKVLQLYSGQIRYVYQSNADKPAALNRALSMLDTACRAGRLLRQYAPVLHQAAAVDFSWGATAELRSRHYSNAARMAAGFAGRGRAIYSGWQRRSCRKKRQSRNHRIERCGGRCGTPRKKRDHNE